MSQNMEKVQKGGRGQHKKSKSPNFEFWTFCDNFFSIGPLSLSGILYFSYMHICLQALCFSLHLLEWAHSLQSFLGPKIGASFF